jgi:hypothetical protein
MATASATAQNFNIRYVPEVFRDAHGGVTAVCTEFRLAASGETEIEAKARLRLIVESFCNSLQRQGLLQKALSQSGISHDPIERKKNEEMISVAA